MGIKMNSSISFVKGLTTSDPAKVKIDALDKFGAKFDNSLFGVSVTIPGHGNALQVGLTVGVNALKDAVQKGQLPPHIVMAMSQFHSLIDAAFTVAYPNGTVAVGPLPTASTEASNAASVQAKTATVKPGMKPADVLDALHKVNPINLNKKVPLTEAVVGQYCGGTESTSTYVCVGVAGLVRLAARYKSGGSVGTLSLRAEGEMPTGIRKVLTSMNFTGSAVAQKHMSLHLGNVAPDMVGRAVGSVVMGVSGAAGIEWLDVLKSMKRVTAVTA